MGTQKQATTLIKLINIERRKQFMGDFSPQQVAEHTAKILAMTLPEVQDAFARVNARTGFDRYSSPATAAQRKRIVQLEVAAYGKPTTTFLNALTFIQASDLITALVAMRAESKSAVRDLETLANSERITSAS